MDEPKVTDKRKAPDKSSSGEMSDDDSLKQQAQVKRPRMEVPVTSEIDTIDAFVVPREGDVLSENLLETNNILGETAESVLKESPDAFLAVQEGVPTQILASDGDQQLDFKILTENGDGGDRSATNHNDQLAELEVQLQVDQLKRVEVVSAEHEAKNLEDSEHNNNDDEKQFQTPTSPSRAREKHEPKLASSPVLVTERDMGTSESEQFHFLETTKVVEVHLRAFDPKSKEVVVKEIVFQSNLEQLRSYLSSNGVTLLVNTSQTSGYSADVSSQDLSQQSKSIPIYTTSRGSKRSRYTSSTLGSSIPRESMATILSTSPHKSPGDEVKPETPAQKKFGRARGPKATSTKIGSRLSSSPLNTSIDKSKFNGDDSSNGVSPKKVKKLTSLNSSKHSEKSSKNKLQLHDKSSSLNSTTSTGSTPSKSKSSKKSTPKSRALSTSLEYSGSTTPGMFSTVNLSTVSVEPSPARTQAKVEGTEAKPLTKFELEVNNEPVVLQDLNKSLTLWGRICPNELCYARWRDKKYYSGIILEKWTNDTYKIDFDDGMDGVASETHIVPIKILGVGTVGVYTPDNMFKPSEATVLGQKFVEDPEVGKAVKYAIKLKGEDTPIWCTRRQLSIEESIAKNLRAEFAPTSKAPKAAELSLGNIVSGPRRRGTVASSNQESSTSKVVGGAFDESLSTSPATKGKKTPKPRGTPTPGKKGRKKVTDSSEMHNSSNLDINSKDASFSNPGSSKASSQDKKHVVVQQDSPKKMKPALLFEGLSFFLTASGGGDPSADIGLFIPYDKDEYRDLIESHGGTIVDSVGKEGKAKDKVFLISDNYARTVKYIYCLAASIPCVSHAWIQKCLDDNSIVSYKKYELNSGMSLEENKVIPAHTHKPLKGMRIFITAGSDDLYNYWKPVLTSAQAILLKSSKKEKEKYDIPQGTDVIVTDATCAPEILEKATVANLPLVKPEWLVQTIIAGKRVDYFGHEKYRVDEPLEQDGDDDEDEEDDEEDEEEDQS